MKSLKNFMMLGLIIFLTGFSVEATAQYVSANQAVSILADQLNMVNSGLTNQVDSNSNFMQAHPAGHVHSASEMYNFVASNLIVQLRDDLSSTVPVAIQLVENKFVAKNFVNATNQSVYDTAKAAIVQTLQ